MGVSFSAGTVQVTRNLFPLEKVPSPKHFTVGEPAVMTRPTIDTWPMESQSDSLFQELRLTVVRLQISFHRRQRL